MSRVLPVAVVTAMLVFSASAFAHVERPSYWPDPAPDTSISPAAGGAVPKVRPLASAVAKRRKGQAGTVRVVCQPDSLKLLRASIRRARKDGYFIRPSDKRALSKKRARQLLKINKKLRRKCRYSEIQPAVTASGNNDRVVIMPGLYTEPTSRSKPTHDKACDRFRTNGDRPGNEGQALSFKYQFNCPNDQNLIAVIGRMPGEQDPPMPPKEDRHNIPDLGPCIRCNLQMEGSGVNADDVVVEAGDASKGDGGPNGAGAVKDVGIRADRADGFVLKNVKVRHAKEHGIYVLESDGYLLTNFKVFYNGLYGVLSFVEDHGRQQNCEGAGHGDSAVYPGAAVETGEQRPPGTEFRYNQEIRWCDLHHNMAGYSGTNGNAIWVHDNRMYDNVLGLTTDVVTGAGHPGYPGDSMLIEKNQFFSNNFNIYAPDSDVKPAFPFPVGTGLWIAGGNRQTVRNNYFYDNWRRGTMLFSVPDALVCGPAAGGNKQAGCDPNRQSTSFYNSQYENKMGVRPDGTADPNGTDFWWDPYPGTVGNCWWDNIPAKGAKITFSPSEKPFPDCNRGSRPDMSVGTGDPRQTGELANCVAAFETRQFDPNGPCPWIKRPPEPQPGGGSSGAKSGPAVPFGFAAAARPRASAAIDPRSDLSGVNCENWISSDEAGKAYIVDRVTKFAGGAVVDGERIVGYGDTLAPDEARSLYDGWCRNRFASGFLLYKLYTYAAVVRKAGD